MSNTDDFFETQKLASLIKTRIVVDLLRRTKAKTKFLSLEPLLGPLDHLNLKQIDWAIAGGESGPGSRPMSKQWVRAIRDQCIEAGVPFHFKQWGGTNKGRTGRTLDGRTWDEWPRTPAKKKVANKVQQDLFDTRRAA